MGSPSPDPRELSEFQAPLQPGKLIASVLVTELTVSSPRVSPQAGPLASSTQVNPSGSTGPSCRGVKALQRRTLRAGESCCPASPAVARTCREAAGRPALVPGPSKELTRRRAGTSHGAWTDTPGSTGQSAATVSACCRQPGGLSLPLGGSWPCSCHRDRGGADREPP